MPIKEILLVALVVAAGHGFAWAFHNVGLSAADAHLISYKRQCDGLVSSQLDAEDRLLGKGFEANP